MSEMKDSGIEWIGEIPKEWEIRKLDAISKRITDFVASGSFASLNENVKYLDEPEYAMLVRTADLSNKRNDKKVYISKKSYDFLRNSNLFGGELILSNIGSVGSVFLYSPLYQYASLAPNAIMIDTLGDNRFFYYWFLNPLVNDELKKLGGSAVQSKFNKTQLRAMLTANPPLPTQERIADYLDQKCAEINAVIQKTKATIDEYKKLKKSVITEAVTKGLNPNVEMKDSGIEWNRHIPLHWNVVNPRRLFKLRKDKAFSDDKQLTASQKHGIIFQDDFMRIENQKVVVVQKDFDILKHVEPNDFVISMRSFQGGLEYSTLKGCISSAYVMLIPTDEVYSLYYKWLFKSEKYINALQSTSNLVRDGQAMRYSNFVQIPLFSIPQNEQKQIADYLEHKCAEIDTLIAKKQTIVAELESYKKSLIYEYVTGKREVATPQISNTAVLAPLVYIDEARRLRAQAALMTKALDAGHTKKKFGRTEWFKNLYLLDACVGFPLKSAYIREEYGPILATNKECENIIFRQNKWFTKINETPTKYVPTKNKDNYISEYESFFSSVSNEIEEMLKKLNPLSMNEVEKIATLYAVWNDFILDGKNYSDNDIVNDVLSNWSNRKRNFSRENWHTTLEQMRKLDIVPKGYGMHTIRR